MKNQLSKFTYTEAIQMVSPEYDEIYFDESEDVAEDDFQDAVRYLRGCAPIVADLVMGECGAFSAADVTLIHQNTAINDESLKKTTYMKNTIAIILMLLWLPVCIVAGVKAIQFNMQCEGYLKRAADANSIQTASAELKRALDYIEAHGMTSGYTSVMWQTPDEDVGFWYNNIRSAYDDLIMQGDKSSPLERSNLLIKLRETLLDSRDGYVIVTAPDGISRFPNNAAFGVIMIFACILFVLGAVLLLWQNE